MQIELVNLKKISSRKEYIKKIWISCFNFTLLYMFIPGYIVWLNKLLWKQNEIFSSFEHKVLMLSYMYCNWPLCIAHQHYHLNIFSTKTSTNCARMILWWSFTRDVQIILIGWISRPPGPKKVSKMQFSNIIRGQVVVHCNNATGVQNGPVQGITRLYWII